MPPPRFAALRHRDFRLYWIGHTVSVSGQQMVWMLEPWLIYEISESKLLLGVNALVQAVPATLLMLLGGAIADKFDQRKLLIGMQVIFIALLGTLAMLALTEQLEVWHIFVGAFLQSAVSSFESPARHSMFPHLVSRDAMPNAVALNASIHPATRIGGPVASGFILAMAIGLTDSPRIAGGIVWLLAIGAVVISILTLIKVRMPPVTRARGRSVLEDMAEGLRFTWRERTFAFLIGLAYLTMFFGNSMGILYPVIAKDVLQLGPDALGVMWGATGTGNFLGVIAASFLASPRYVRLALVGGLFLLGVSMVGFALTPIYWLSLAMLVAVGIGGSVTNVGIQQNLQLLVPNQVRGRVMGLWSVVHSSVRPLGEMQFSGVAALVTAPFALILSGVIIVASAVFFTVHERPTRRIIDLREEAVAEEARTGG